MTRGLKKRLWIYLAIFGVYFLLNLVAILLGEWNYRKLRDGADLHFSLHMGDGGTALHRGFGYDLMSMHRIYSENGEHAGYTVGPKIEYAFWVLWPNHEDTRLERLVKKEELPSPMTEDMLSDILSKESHRLTFENYGNQGAAFMEEVERQKEIASWSPEDAVYVLDGHRIGVGKQGWENLKLIVKKMPKGNRISLGNYYGGGGFPFPQTAFSEVCMDHGIAVGVPAR